MYACACEWVSVSVPVMRGERKKAFPPTGTLFEKIETPHVERRTKDYFLNNSNADKFFQFFY